MNRRLIVLHLVMVASLLGASMAAGQMVVRHGGGEEGDVDIMLLNELGIVVGMDDGSGDLKVMVLLPDADPAIEIQRDDLLLMINGERVRDMATLRAAYESAAIGDEVKIGFRRGDRRFISSFEKEDPEMPEGAKQVVMIGGPGGEFDDMQPLHEFGVILGEMDGEVVVAMRLPLDDAPLDEDDVLQSVNGTAVASLEEFRSVYEPLAIGDAVDVIALRDGQEIRASRTKAEFQGRIKVQKGP
jgi:S1-C subfamily serine protease